MGRSTLYRAAALSFALALLSSSPSSIVAGCNIFQIDIIEQ